MSEPGIPGWASLTEAVGEGNLYVERGVAQNCASHCSELVTRLAELRDRANLLGDFAGLGTFPSGIALVTKFSRKAVGGDYSMVQALTDHIAEVEAMRDVFARIEARYVEAEQRGVEAFGVIDAQ